jgi:hypothetical protein
VDLLNNRKGILMAQAAGYRSYPESRVRSTSTDAVNVTALPSALQRVSWGAVFAGVVVAIIVHITLSMLGISIGAATINPLSEQNPAEGVGTGALMWMAGSALLAMFAGGWVAGRLAGIPHHLDGALHGILTWGLTTIITLMLLASGVSNVVNSVATVIGQGVNTVTQGAENVAPEVADALERQDISLQGIREEIASMMVAPGTVLSQTPPTTSAPTDATGTDTGTTGTGTEAAGTTLETTGATQNQGMTTGMLNLDNMTAAQREADFVVSRFLRLGANATPDDRAEVTNLLVTRAGMSEEQAQQTVDRWQQQFQQFSTQAEEAARVAGERVADTVAAAAGGAFLLLLLGAFAAAGGGHVGAPEDLSDVVENETVMTTDTATS